jgi:preprotein translocase subunit SecA
MPASTSSRTVQPNLDPEPDGVSRAQRRGLVKLRRATEKHLERLAALDGPALAQTARAAAAEGDTALGVAAAAVAAQRALGMTARPNQLLTAVALSEGFLVELATGEGKTLAATLAAAWLALSGEGVHVITANEYLARRDAAWMLPVYRELNLTVAAATDEMSVAQRREAYAADVTYATVARVGFDHLLDHLVNDARKVVLRGRVTAIVDEVDAILIDEGRTPLVISTGATATVDLAPFARIAASLVVDDEVEVDLAGFTVALTDQGAARVEEVLGLDDLWHQPQVLAYLHAAMLAEHLYRRDRDYVVRDGEVLLIDENTGRTMPGRRVVDGVHDALEAKEGVPVRAAAPSRASISVWALLRGYRHLCGLSGTVASDAAELFASYDTPTAVIPPHLPSARRDLPDALYTTGADRDAALAQLVLDASREGRPVLVGAPSVADAERVTAVLQQAGLTPALLTARDHAAEATIIAQAGRPGAVTVATNMAGRGVDIRLGGHAAALACDELGLDPSLAEQLEHRSDDALAARVAHWAAVCAVERDRVLAAGGLLVLSTSRFSSVRVDNQLRGRCARNGEPGETRFLVSLEDDLVAVFSRGAAGMLLKQLASERATGAKDKLVAKTVAAAQAAVETSHRESRSSLLRYEEVVDEHRRGFYRWREWVLQATLAELVDDAATTVGLEPGQVLAELNLRIAGAPETAVTAVLRSVVCQLADDEWASFLADLHAVERATRLRSSAKLDPLNEYTIETSRLYTQLTRTVAEQTLEAIDSMKFTPATSAA